MNTSSCDELITLFIAGHETTANLLACCLSLVTTARHRSQRAAGIGADVKRRTQLQMTLPTCPTTRRVLDDVPPLSARLECSRAPLSINIKLAIDPFPAHSFLAITHSPVTAIHGLGPTGTISTQTACFARSRPNTPPFVYFPGGGGPPPLPIGRDSSQVEAPLILATVLTHDFTCR